MNEPAVLRVVRFDEERRRNGERLLVAIGLGALALAGVLLLIASPYDRDARSVEVWAVFLAGTVVLPSWLAVRRQKRSPIYVTADEEGLVWGTDRAVDLSLPWTAIEKVRALPDPYREGVMYSFSFLPVAGYVSPGQHRDLGRTGGSAYLYTVDTRYGDCPPDEFRDLIASRRPDLPILFGSFQDPA